MKTTVVRPCPLCGQPMWQKHMEVCTGALSKGEEASVEPGRTDADAAALPVGGARVAALGVPSSSESACFCPPGWRHLPDCPEVTGGNEAA